MKSRLGITRRRLRFSVGTTLHPLRMTSLTRAELGALGEQLAVDHLRGRGLQLLTRNWRCRYGELDLIVADKRAKLRLMQHNSVAR
jgi:putative endonuclease